MMNANCLKKNNVQINDYIIRGRIYIRNSGELKIGKNFNANSGERFNPIGGDTIMRMLVGKNASLIIGDYVGMSNSTIRATKSVQIGNNVMVGGDCKIWDTDFHSLDPNDRIAEDINVKSKEIVIEDNVLVGGGSIILKGVSIGKNSIVGAGSVVSKSIPSNEIWAGNPAKLIRKIDA